MPRPRTPTSTESILQTAPGETTQGTLGCLLSEFADRQCRLTPGMRDRRTGYSRQPTENAKYFGTNHSRTSRQTLQNPATAEPDCDVQWDRTMASPERLNVTRTICRVRSKPVKSDPVGSPMSKASRWRNVSIPRNINRPMAARDHRASIRPPARPTAATSSRSIRSPCHRRRTGRLPRIARPRPCR